uniref:Uncharacterized protein n=1 Tax=Clastoptera arizonana TaxID=38151 RepID=A0A1B6C3Q3_9HEMI
MKRRIMQLPLQCVVVLFGLLAGQDSVSIFICAEEETELWYSSISVCSDNILRRATNISLESLLNKRWDFFYSSVKNMCSGSMMIFGHIVFGYYLRVEVNFCNAEREHFKTISKIYKIFQEDSEIIIVDTFFDQRKGKFKVFY